MFRDCICGKKSQCQGLTSAFYLLHDRRAGFTKLPRRTDNVNDDVKKLREAYLRHLGIDDDPFDSKEYNDDTHQKKRKHFYIANHHFHPEIVKMGTVSNSGKYKLPALITKNEMMTMELNLTEKDLFGPDDDYYYAVPTYSYEKVYRDLKKESKANKQKDNEKIKDECKEMSTISSENRSTSIYPVMNFPCINSRGSETKQANPLKGISELMINHSLSEKKNGSNKASVKYKQNEVFKSSQDRLNIPCH